MTMPWSCTKTRVEKSISAWNAAAELLVNLVMIIKGIAIWVEGRRDLGLWGKLNTSLRTERREVHTLGRPAVKTPLSSVPVFSEENTSAVETR